MAVLVLSGCTGDRAEDAGRDAAGGSPRGEGSDAAEVDVDVPADAGSAGSAMNLADDDAVWQLATVELDGGTDPWSVVIVGRWARDEVDLAHPWPTGVGGVIALDADRRHLLVAVLGGLDRCHLLAGVDVELDEDEVRVAPRFGRAAGYLKGCTQPGPTLATPVDLGEPIGDRSVLLLHCAGVGWDDCETIAHRRPTDLPVARRAEVTCVPVERLLQTQRPIHDLIERCDPEAEPMLGVMPADPNHLFPHEVPPDRVPEEDR